MHKYTERSISVKIMFDVMEEHYRNKIPYTVLLKKYCVSSSTFATVISKYGRSYRRELELKYGSFFPRKKYKMNKQE